MKSNDSKGFNTRHIAKSLEPITEGILAYVNDESNNYAIGLEGDWGSGKTSYLKYIIEPKLQKNKRTMILISLFGVESQDELYEKNRLSSFTP